MANFPNNGMNNNPYNQIVQNPYGQSQYNGFQPPFMPAPPSVTFALVEGEQAVQNFLVGTNVKAILIDFTNMKLYIKERDANNIPQTTRVIDMVEPNNVNANVIPPQQIQQAQPQIQNDNIQTQLDELRGMIQSIASQNQSQVQQNRNDTRKQKNQ